MVEDTEGAGDEELSRPNPAGLDDSEWFAAERLFETLTDAIQGAQSVVNHAEVLRIQTVLAGWDAMVLDEEARGRAVHVGGVQEKAFAIHLGALLRMSPRGAVALLHDALTIRSRLPLTWGAFCDGRFAWRAAALIADASACLLDEPLAEYDRAAELAEELPPHQLRNELERLRDRLDAAAAAERAEHAARSRHVAAAPQTGQGSLTFRGPQTDVAAMYDAVRQIAVDAHGREGETRPLGALMFDAGADLILHGAANPPTEPVDPSTPAERLGDVRVPGRKAVQATLLVLAPAATACGEGQQPSALAGWGSLTAAETRRIVASTSTWTRVLVDPIDDAVLGIDSTERYIPAGLRKLLQARDQTCRGPGCNRPSHRCDADHTVRFEHGGHTGETNLAILCRPDHQAKDAGYLDVRRRPDGSLRWRTRWGATVVTKPALTVRRPPPTEPPF